MWNTIETQLQKKNKSLYWLSKTARVPYPTLLNIRDGKSKNPSIFLMFRVADALGIDVNEFRKE